MLPIQSQRRKEFTRLYMQVGGKIYRQDRELHALLTGLYLTSKSKVIWTNVEDSLENGITVMSSWTEE